jgi:hypothetical protein
MGARRARMYSKITMASPASPANPDPKQAAARGRSAFAVGPRGSHGILRTSNARNRAYGPRHEPRATARPRPPPQRAEFFGGGQYGGFAWLLVREADR